MHFTKSVTQRIKICHIILLIFTLCACDEVTKIYNTTFKKNDTSSDNAPETIEIIERDIEAPDIFDITETAFWEGATTAGGIWATYPKDIQLERVIIRNKTNGKFVIGTLLNHNNTEVGPYIGLSSDAAAALDIPAGMLVEVTMTALRRETVTVNNTAQTTGTIAPRPNNTVQKIDAQTLPQNNETTEAKAATSLPNGLIQSFKQN